MNVRSVQYKVLMKKVISASRARKEFFDLLEQVDTTGEPITVTVDGEPKAVFMNPGEYESWLETMEVMADTQLMKDIREGEADIAAGRVHTFEEVHGMTPEEYLRRK